MAKTIRDIAIAAFFFVLSGILLVGVSTGKEALGEWKKAKVAQIEGQQEMLAFIRELAERGYDDFSQARKAEIEHLQNLTKKAEKGGLFLEELGVLLAARALEIDKALPASSADEFARETIHSIKSNHSERIGKLLEAMNDKYLRERR